MLFRTKLLLLVLGSVLPLALLAAAIAFWGALNHRKTTAEGMHHVASVLAATVDRELQSTISVLEGLAVADALARDDLSAFRAQALRLLLRRPNLLNLVLLDANGQQLINTAIAADQPLPFSGGTPDWQRVIEHKRPVVVLIRGPVLKRLAITIALPVLRDGLVRYVLAAAIPPDAFTALLERQIAADGWFASVVDSNGVIVARSRNAVSTVGKKIADFSGREFSDPDDLLFTVSVEGTSVYVVRSRLQTADWFVSYAAPANVIDRVYKSAGMLAATAALMVLAFALPMALILGRRLTCEVAALAERASGLTSTTTMDQRFPTQEIVAVHTAMTAAAAQLRDREDRLRQALSKAEAARGEAVRANREKSTFLASASHDLRQPAQSLILFIGVLQEKLQGHPAAHIVDVLQEAANALRAILDSLLDLSRIEAGLISIQEVDTPLGDLFRRLQNEYSPAASAKGLKLRIVESRAVVRTDPTLLERMLRNLVENAIKYTAAGGVLIGCRRHGPLIWLQVMDTGIGIGPEHVDAVFEDYYQVGNPERDRAKGFGLGLAIVQRLGNALKHSVGVRSSPGRGSCFYIELPLIGVNPVKRREVLQEVVEKSANSGLVLLVEDDPQVREAISIVLNRGDYEVVAAESVTDAIALLQGRCPNLIIADFRLRDHETGDTVIKRVRSACKIDVPAIIMTGDTSPERLKAANLVRAHLLHKPVSVPELLSSISRVLQDRAPRRGA